MGVNPYAQFVGARWYSPQSLAGYNTANTAIGPIGSTKMFYGGALPSTFVGQPEDLIPPGVLVVVTYKTQTTNVASYIASIAAAGVNDPHRQIILVYYQEPEGNFSSGATFVSQFNAQSTIMRNAINAHGLAGRVRISMDAGSFPYRPGGAAVDGSYIPPASSVDLYTFDHYKQIPDGTPMLSATGTSAEAKAWQNWLKLVVAAGGGNVATGTPGTVPIGIAEYGIGNGSTEALRNSQLAADAAYLQANFPQTGGKLTTQPLQVWNYWWVNDGTSPGGNPPGGTGAGVNQDWQFPVGTATSTTWRGIANAGAGATTINGTATLAGTSGVNAPVVQLGHATLSATSSANNPVDHEAAPITLAGAGTVSVVGNAFFGQFLVGQGTVLAKATQVAKSALTGAGTLSSKVTQVAAAALSATSSMVGGHTQSVFSGQGTLTAVGTVTGTLPSTASFTWNDYFGSRNAALSSSWAVFSRVQSQSPTMTWAVGSARSHSVAFEWVTLLRVRSGAVDESGASYFPGLILDTVMHPIDTPAVIASSSETGPQSTWKDYFRVASACTLTWNTLEQVSPVAYSQWNVAMTRVAAPLTMNWNVLSNFSFAYSRVNFRWDIYQRRHNVSAVIAWDTRSAQARVSKPSPLMTWNTIGRRHVLKSSTWETRGSVRVSSALTFTWQVLKHVARTGSLIKWQTTARTHKPANSMAFNDLVRRSKLQHATWDTAARFSKKPTKFFFSSWVVYQRKPALTLASTWDTRKHVVKTAVLMKWNTRFLVDPLAVCHWNDYQRRKNTKLLGTKVFSVFSNAFIILPGIQWNDRHSIVSSKQAKWNTHKLVTKSLTSWWDFTPRISKPPVLMEWNTRHRTSVIYHCTFQENQRVFMPIALSKWDIFTPVHVPVTIEWNVGMPVQGNIRRMSKTPWGSTT